MRVWYWLHKENIINFGEHITGFILDYFGVKWTDFSKSDSDTCLLIIGSELHKSKMNELRNAGIKKVHIWGQGRGHDNVFDKSEYDVEFHLVRGDRTKTDYDLPNTVPTGDPAFILPLIFPIDADKSFGITYAPHMQNRKDIIAKKKQMGFDDYFDVMFQKGIFPDRLKRLVKSEFVLTNSLHVTIVCLAYNVPFSVCLREDENFVMPDKWKDVFEWCGLNFEIVHNYKQGLKWWKKEVKGKELPDAKKILDSFPKHIFDEE